MQITLTNEQRFAVLSLFEMQVIKADSYEAAKGWCNIFDGLINNWDWRSIFKGGINELKNPNEGSTYDIDVTSAKFIFQQILSNITMGMQGGQARILIGVMRLIESILAAQVEAPSVPESETVSNE